MVLGVDSHSVVVAAAFYWVTSQHGIRSRVDFRNFVCISQIDVYLAGDGVVLGHAGLAFEFDSFNNFILVHIHYRNRLPERIRNVHLVKRRGVCAPVGFCGRRKPLDHAHASQIYDADLFFPPI